MKDLLVEIFTGVGIAILGYISYTVSQYVEQKKKALYDENRNTKLAEIQNFITERLYESMASMGVFDTEDNDVRRELSEAAVNRVLLSLPHDTIDYLVKHLVKNEESLREWLTQLGATKIKEKTYGTTLYKNGTNL